jgi:hypothetical protein
MKSILKQIFGNNTLIKSNQHKAWLADIQELDDLPALQFATKHLTQLLNPIDDAESPNLEQQIELIFELEALNQKRLEKLSAQLANVENMKIELENAIFDACYNYCRQSYIFHLKVIEQAFSTQHANSEKTSSEKTGTSKSYQASDSTLILLIARALHSAFNMVKWRLFSQTSPPAKVWLQINTLYKLATQRSLLNNPTELFNGAPSTTLAANFVQCWMLGQLAQASMQKYQVEITARILTTLLTRTHISNKYTLEQYLFFIDLEKDVAAKRMRDAYASESCRYWELDELEKQLTVAATVSDRGEIPQSLAFSKIDHAQKLNVTLLTLIDEWKRLGYLRQRRKAVRQASSKTARVNAGIADICNQVRQANQISSGLRISRDGATLDERLRAHTTLGQNSNLTVNSGSLDTWIITDESLQGLGTRVNKYANILARPNKLLGLMIDDDPSKVILGMIRSIKPTQANQLRVGIEIISHHPKWVQLSKARHEDSFADTVMETSLMGSKTTNATADVGFFAGIYMPIEAGLSETSMLLLPKTHYQANQSYIINVDGNANQILLEDPVESYDDWVKVAFPF